VENIEEDKRFVSVVIPAHNAGSHIKKCLDSIMKLQAENFDYEVLVVNDASTDETVNLLKDFKNIRVISNEINLGPSASRNKAIEVANGSLIAFTDSDCVVSHNWLQELLKCSNYAQLAGCGGSQLSPKDETKFGRLVNDFLKIIGFLGDYTSSVNRVKETRHNPSCNSMYKKDVLSAVGGFLEGLYPGEDIELDYRLKRGGWKLYYNPQAIVYHYRPSNIKSFVSMVYRYGKTSGGVLTKRLGMYRITSYIPLLCLGMLLFGVIILFLSSDLFIFSALLSTLLLYIYLLFRLGGVIRAFQAVFLLLLTSISWNTGFFIGYFKKGSL